MKTSKFKTNAKCGGCVARIGEKLDKMIPGQQWDIDLTTPERILTCLTNYPLKIKKCCKVTIFCRIRAIGLQLFR